ncbi:MAG: glycogen/starch synthase [Chitinophagales bacterium]|nr:glycogen/starch synthase [Chitinophagales bacterium]
MEKKRVLIVTQELKPYLIESEISQIIKNLPQHIQDSGMEIRVLMPRFGNINERRHRLHEVVRLSGINITVDKEDFPLMIKVASLPGARMQVYFLDNEEFFKRKAVFKDDNDQFFEDNSDRMIFFCKGVIETVKKFGWPPHIIHCHGWMTSLIPYYLKTMHKDDMVFNNTKVIYSVYENSFNNKLADTFVNRALHTVEDFAPFSNADNTSLNLGAAAYADAVIQASDNIADPVKALLAKNGKPVLGYIKEEDEYLRDYQLFYERLLEVPAAIS